MAGQQFTPIRCGKFLPAVAFRLETDILCKEEPLYFMVQLTVFSAVRPQVRLFFQQTPPVVFGKPIQNRFKVFDPFRMHIEQPGDFTAIKRFRRTMQEEFGMSHQQFHPFPCIEQQPATAMIGQLRAGK